MKTTKKFKTGGKAEVLRVEVPVATRRAAERVARAHARRELAEVLAVLVGELARLDDWPGTQGEKLALAWLLTHPWLHMRKGRSWR